MKLDTNTIINKLISYAFDNLLLDPLDETYTLNRLATLCGVPAPVRDEDADYGDAVLTDLLGELKAACPAADVVAVKNALIPMPRTVNGYFTGAKTVEKGFEFLYELYAHCDCGLSASQPYEKDGFTAYPDGHTELKLIALDGAVYVPKALSATRVAELEAEDILTEDVLAREAAFVNNYGGVIAYRLGDEKYLTASAFALTRAKTEKTVSDGPVKVTLLDYPVPVIAFNGIAKNAVAREVIRAAKAAADSEYKFVIAAAPKDGVTYYLVFANDLPADEYVLGHDSLTACGVYGVADYSELLSVLGKGTALSTDLIRFKPVYDVIGGVKHGNNAAVALGGFLADKFKPLLTAAKSATNAQVEALLSADKDA